MASGMKLWSAVVVLLCAGVVWAALPPRTADAVVGAWPRSAWTPASPEEQHRARLGRAVRQANHALRTVRLEDSLKPMVLEHGATGVWLGLPGPDRPEEEVASLRGSLADEIPPDAPGKAAVGIAFLPSRAGGWPGVPTTSVSGYYFGESPGGTPYCLAARAPGGPPGSAHFAYRNTPGRSLTGLCRWIHRYGLPGEWMSGWLTAGGSVTASGLAPFEDVRTELRPPDLPVRRRGAFGVPGGLALVRRGGGFAQALTPARDGCLAGRPDACVETVLAAAPASSRTAFQAEDHWPAWFQDAFLMIALEEAFGPERFQAFWSSDAPVPEAFREAFGEPMGPWLLEWYGEHTGIVPAGPAPRLAGLLSALAVLALAGVVAGALVGRWRVTA